LKNKNISVKPPIFISINVCGRERERERKVDVEKKKKRRDVESRFILLIKGIKNVSTVNWG
jgi:hypothetical protein